MTAQPSLFSAQKAPTLVEKLAQHFKAHPYEWVDGMQLAGIAGSYAWRSRCSDLRRAPFSMTIENKVVVRCKYRQSFYRYVPSAQQEVA